MTVRHLETPVVTHTRATHMRVTHINAAQQTVILTIATHIHVMFQSRVRMQVVHHRAGQHVILVSQVDVLMVPTSTNGVATPMAKIHQPRYQVLQEQEHTACLIAVGSVIRRRSVSHRVL